MRHAPAIALGCALALWAAAAPPPADAADAPDAADPLDAVRAALDRAREVVDVDAPRAEKLESLRGTARELLDTRAMGRHALGATLDARSASEREAYFALFDEVIVRAYLQKLLLFSKPRFGYAPPRVDGDDAFVRTKILTGGDAYFVDYTLVRRGDRWWATDVIVEGMSLSDSYREQFTSLVRSRGFEGLLELMRRRVGGAPR